MPSVGQLLIKQTRDGARHTLALEGELDLATAPDLEDTIAALCLDRARELVLDLRHVVFIDSCGLRTVLAAMEMCRLHGCEFMLVAGTGASRRLFELTGVIGDLPLREPDELVEPPA
jgi:anti-sigma B factor antagonist